MTKVVRSGRGEHVGSLQQQFLRLQREWNTYKKSAPPRSHRSPPMACASAPVAPATPQVITELFDSLPKQLLSSLQQRDESPTEVWGVRSVDWDAEKIVMERKTAIKSGRLRGRSLLEALESARDDAPGKDDTRSASPSVLIHGCGASPMRSSSCGCSCSACSSCSSLSEVNHVGGLLRSSSSSFSPERVEREKAVGATSGSDATAAVDDGGRRMVGMACLAVVLMLFSLGIISLMGLSGEQDGGFLIPT